MQGLQNVSRGYRRYAGGTEGMQVVHVCRWYRRYVGGTEGM